MSEDHDGEIIRRDLDTDVENPTVPIAEIVSDLEDKETEELPTMYECVDGVLDNLYSQPPSPEAQMQVEFSYATFRITVHQDGLAEFVKMS